ncbi:MAG: cytochrome c oxidase subunit II [Planctomycetaceae bacterium]
MEKKFWVGLFVVWPVAAVAVCWLAPSLGWWFPPNPADASGGTGSASEFGHRIDDLFYMILVITSVTFILTHAALAYVMWKGSNVGDSEKAWFSHGSHSLEVIWTIVPAVILLFIAFVQLDVWADYRVISKFPEEAKANAVAEITARQFEWRIRYPAPGKKLQDDPQPDDLYMVNELHVPSGRDVMIYLKTEDVQHAFFMPELRVKQDAVPGLRIPIWFNAEKSETYTLVCAELCGWGHYKMGAEVIAESEESFDSYMLRLQEEQNYDGIPVADADSEEDDEV